MWQGFSRAAALGSAGLPQSCAARIVSAGIADTGRHHPAQPRIAVERHMHELGWPERGQIPAQVIVGKFQLVERVG